ncbi:MAG: DUF5060 domain-containing protein, partial [Anaerolineae bacterium]|nr:DUF5060 domain-containing protein [Anaerolineae bacterium]
TIDFVGPFAQETDDAPNPFLDYRLQVTFTSTQGQVYHVPGFFAGDGQGNGSGNVWRVIFAPDRAGLWQYTAAFHTGANIAVDLDMNNGTPHSFHGASGSFQIHDPICPQPGFLAHGRLEYVGGHFLKFADGDYWIKGGIDSPENFLAYAGFDNTVSQGGPLPDFLHYYEPHRADWQPGDPNFVSADTGDDAKGIIGALNYLSSQGINSIYFLPMNLGGDGQDVYPFVAPENTRYNKTHYDISKLHQWGIVLNHAQNKGIALHMVLAENEFPNRNWLDGGALGVERKLFYRELIARFGHLLAIKWNLSEENEYSVEQLHEFAAYIRALDWNKHQMAVHTHLDDFSDYLQLLGDPKFTTTSIQYTSALASDFVDSWRIYSADTGRPWVVDMDENFDSLTSSNEDILRVQLLYPIYFSGGNIEWYLGYHPLPMGGDLNLEDFRYREKMWRYTRYARQFMSGNLPFWQMAPDDTLLSGENISRGKGQVFAKAGEVYALYLPVADGSGQLNLSGVSGSFRLRWFDPRTGTFVGGARMVPGGGLVTIGSPPQDVNMDWVVLLQHSQLTGLNQPMEGTHAVFLPVLLRSCSYAASP